MPKPAIITPEYGLYRLVFMDTCTYHQSMTEAWLYVLRLTMENTYAS